MPFKFMAPVIICVALATGIANTASSVEGRTATIRTIDGNYLTIARFMMINNGRRIRSLYACWNGGFVKLNLSSIQLIIFTRNKRKDFISLFTDDLTSSDCSFKGFETKIRFHGGRQGKFILMPGPYIVGISSQDQWLGISELEQLSELEQWSSDLSTIREIRLM